MALLATSLLATVARADTTWKGTTGNFSDPANWTNGVPFLSTSSTTESSDGFINNAGIALITAPVASNIRSVLLATASGTSGSIRITGAGRAYISSFIVGAKLGTGNLLIADGGQLTTDNLPVAADFGSVGTIMITGANSSLTSNIDLRLGNTGTATLNLENGGALKVGENGTGPLYLAGEYVAVANLNIGNGTAIGSFRAGEIRAGEGLATLTFSQTNNITVSTTLTGAASYAHPEAIFNVVQSGSGKTTLTSQTSTMAGHTTVTAGTLLVNGRIEGALTDVVVDEMVVTQKFTGDFTVQQKGTLGGTGYMEGKTTIGGKPETTTTTNGTTTTTPSTLGGTLAPGDGIGLLSFGSDLTFGSAATLSIEIGGRVRGTGYDAINVAGALTYGGTLKLTLANGFQPNLNDAFDFFNGYTSFVSTFSSIIFDKPGYSGAFNPQTGILTVTSVPEPGTAALALLGVAALGLKRRRA